jgi:signal peptidase II
MGKYALQLWGAGVALAVFTLDQLSKYVLRVYVVPQEYSLITVTPFFNLNHAWNYGVSFSLFAGEGDWRRLKLIVLALLITALVSYWLARTQVRLQALAYGLIIGGALGNICDRMVHGAVFDFLQFHLAGFYWPSFNLADSAIFIGVAILLWDSFWGSGKHHA